MRPLGALVLGACADRRAGLLLSLSPMSVGIFSIACTPGYSTIGLIAPMLVLIGRLLQVFSAGMELGGVSVYLSEIAPPGRSEILGTLKINWRVVLIGTFLMVTMTTVSFYMTSARVAVSETHMSGLL